MPEAIALLEQALAIDVCFAPAAALIGWCHVFQRALAWGPLSGAEVAEAVRLARQAVEIRKDDPETLWMGGHVISFLDGDHLGARPSSTALSR